MNINNNPLTGIFESTPLSRLFFSPDNIKIIQKNLKEYIKKETKQNIDNQDSNELMVIMRYIYLTKSEFKDTDIKKQLSMLNYHVIKECAPIIITNLRQYVKFLQDRENPLKPMSMPQNTNIKGTKGLQPNHFI